MQTKQFLFASFLFATVLVSLGGNTFAQQETVRGPEQGAEPGAVVVSQKTAVIANVGIYSASFIQKGNREVSVGFTLRSDLGTQAGVRFGLNAYRKTAEGLVLVDTSVASESLTLPAKEYVYREISYVPPATISGELDLFVVARTETNLQLSESPVGTHIFSELKDAPSVTLQNCDISKFGSSTVRCTVRNQSSQGVTAIFYSELRKDSLFGTLISSPFSRALTLKSRESQSVDLNNIPDLLTAGIYSVEAKVLLRDTPDILIDRRVFSAQVAGPVNRIANVFVTEEKKRTFTVGVVSLSPTKNTSVQVVFMDNNEVCGEKVTAFSSPRTDVLVSTNLSCVPSEVRVSLLTASGDVLDTRVIAYTPPLLEKYEVGDLKTFLYGLLGVLGLLFAYVLVRRRTHAIIRGTNTPNQ